MPTSAANILHRLDELHYHLPAGIVIHAMDGRIVSANRPAQELLGLSEAQLLGVDPSKSDWKIIRDDGSAMPPEEFPGNLVLSTGRNISNVVVGIVYACHRRWLLCNAYPEFDERGNVHCAVVCFTDCTSLKETQQSLAKSEERLRLVLKGSTDAPWDWDLTSGEVYYSERWWNMLGYCSGEGIDDAEAWRRLLHPDDSAVISNYLKDLLPGKSEVFDLEFRLRHCDGHYVPVLSRGFVLRNEEGIALRISGVNTDLTAQKENERRIYKLAYFDYLTGLPNRRFLLEELDHVLARSVRSRRYGALLHLDLDNFKLLNDTMGHDIGDMLLRQVSQRLRFTVRQSDQLARLGGDEFVIVLEDLSVSNVAATAEADRIVAKLLFALGQPFQLNSLLFKSTASIGISVFNGANTDVETLLKQADLAMYRAKAEGRNGARYFDSSMQDAANHRAKLENSIQNGLSVGEFQLFFQPQFDGRGRLVGAEALARWRRDDDDVIGPDQFIRFAEESGLIHPLGAHILKESCRALTRWQRDPILRRLKLSVNVSIHQMRDSAFPELVARVLEITGARPTKLCLEITESVFAENMEEITQRMHEIRSQGIQFSLDDFGTSYSSLSYLKYLPLTALKIDRSFVHNVYVDPDSGTIVEAIIALARKLKLEIVAEGVEHESQRDFLVRSGCSLMPGFLLGRPLPLEQFEHVYSAIGIGHA